MRPRQRWREIQARMAREWAMTVPSGNLSAGSFMSPVAFPGPAPSRAQPSIPVLTLTRLVGPRMRTTGESYTAARARLLAAEEPEPRQEPAFTMSDDAIRRRTGCGWEELFELLEDRGAIDRSHTEIARWLREEHRIEAWDAQSVTLSYERAGGGGPWASTPRERVAALKRELELAR
jgi:hypothetical protein